MGFFVFFEPSSIAVTIAVDNDTVRQLQSSGQGQLILYGLLQMMFWLCVCIYAFSCRCTGHGGRTNGEQAALDDVRLRQAVMAHHLEARRRQQQQDSMDMPLARKQELIHNFLLVEELTPALVRELVLQDADNKDDASSNKDTTVSQLPACAVCLEPFQLGDVVGKAQNDACKHVYHKDCIAEWLLHNMDCPLCKRNFLSLANSDDDDDNNNAEDETTSRTSATSGDEESGRIVETNVTL